MQAHLNGLADQIDRNLAALEALKARFQTTDDQLIRKVELSKKDFLATLDENIEKCSDQLKHRITQAWKSVYAMDMLVKARKTVLLYGSYRPRRSFVERFGN